VTDTRTGKNLRHQRRQSGTQTRLRGPELTQRNPRYIVQANSETYRRIHGNVTHGSYLGTAEELKTTSNITTVRGDQRMTNETTAISQQSTLRDTADKRNKTPRKAARYAQRKGTQNTDETENRRRRKHKNMKVIHKRRRHDKLQVETQHDEHTRNKTQSQQHTERAEPTEEVKRGHGNRQRRRRERGKRRA